MRKITSVNTMRYQDASLEQEEKMRVESADMDTQECVYISRLEGVKRGTIAIFTMEEKESTATGVKTSTTLTFPMILMATDGTIQMLAMGQQIFAKEGGLLHKTHQTFLF